MDSYEVFYYPYSGMNPNRVHLVKQLLLYYDRVYVLGFGICGYDILKEKPWDESESRSQMLELTDEKLVTEVNPKEIIERNEPLIGAETIKDLDLFQGNDLGPEGYTWEIANAKIAESVRKHLKKSHSESNQWSHLTWPEGEAVLLNHTYFAVGKLNASPITDDPVHHRAFHLKIRRHLRDLWKGISSYANIDDYEFKRTDYEKMLVQHALTKMVPILREPYSISIEELLEFRNRTRNYRSDFIEHIKLVIERNTEEGEDFDPQKSFNQEFLAVVRKLRREIEKLERPNWRDEDAGHVALKSVAATSLKMLFPAIEFAIKAAGPVRGASKRKEYKRLEKNSLFYLIELMRYFSL